MEQQIFYQLSIVMAIAAGVSLLTRIFRQPMIVGYIIAGFLVGPSFLNVIQNRAAFDSFSQIGIALLLFIVGLGLNVGIIKTTGKPVLLSFLATVVGIGGITFGVNRLLGMSATESLIIAVTLLFSSTIIVVKSISDKKEQSRLYAKIAIGVLLVEDLAAIFALLVIGATAGGNAPSSDVLQLVARGIGLAGAMILVGGYVMPSLSKLFAGSQELLYVFAIAWAFGVATLFSKAGFSIEVGALVAGVSLASLPYVQAIESRLKPLRDFFLVLFFITLGEGLHVGDFKAILVPTIIFSAISLFLKPLFRLITLGLLGYTKQTAFKTSVHLSQVSEFAIILVVLAASKHLVSDQTVTALTLTAIITIAASSYLMKYDDALYRKWQKQLSFFERSDVRREVSELGHYPLVLLGYHNSGYNFVRTFREMKKRYVVIDYNPDIIDTLEHQHINHIYGDATDTELLNEIGLHKSELVISTINDATTNRMLAEQLVDSNDEAIFICHAANLDDANSLYDAGASYVMLPNFIGDEHINSFIRRNGSNRRAFSVYRKHHLLTLGKLVSQQP